MKNLNKLCIELWNSLRGIRKRKHCSTKLQIGKCRKLMNFGLPSPVTSNDAFGHSIWLLAFCTRFLYSSYVVMITLRTFLINGKRRGAVLLLCCCKSWRSLRSRFSTFVESDAKQLSNIIAVNWRLTMYFKGC